MWNVKVIQIGSDYYHIEDDGEPFGDLPLHNVVGEIHICEDVEDLKAAIKVNRDARNKLLADLKKFGELARGILKDLGDYRVPSIQCGTYKCG